jgi:uncharacterized protein YjbJ (UPF0337 family)
MSDSLINQIQTKWGKFSKRRLESMKGDLGELVDMLQSAYGYTKNRAEREYHEFQLTLRPGAHPQGKR